MKKTNEVTERVVKKVVEKLAEPTPWEWPPQCIGFMYQPVRPRRSEEKFEERTRFQHQRLK